jgi:hypothetical protein
MYSEKNERVASRSGRINLQLMNGHAGGAAALNASSVSGFWR